MSSSTSISVVIPVRDRSVTLVRAVRSVLEQNVDALEVVVVDDGSTITIGDALGDLSNDARLRLIHQSAAGASAARNRGIAESRGDYIALLDSDDFFRPDRLTRQLEAMNRHSAAFSLCRRLVQVGSRLVDTDHATTAGDPFVSTYRDFAARHWPLSASLMMFRRDALNNPLFDPTLPSANDLDALLTMLGREPVLLVDEPLVIMDKAHDEPRLSDHFEDKLASYHRLEQKLTGHAFGIDHEDIKALVTKLDRDRLFLHFLRSDAAAFRSLYAGLNTSLLPSRDRTIFAIMRGFTMVPPLLGLVARTAEMARKWGLVKM